MFGQLTHYTKKQVLRSSQQNYFAFQKNNLKLTEVNTLRYFQIKDRITDLSACCLPAIYIYESQSSAQEEQYRKIVRIQNIMHLFSMLS